MWIVNIPPLQEKNSTTAKHYASTAYILIFIKIIQQNPKSFLGFTENQ